MSHQAQLANIVSKMFLRYPAAAKTSADQVRVYVDDLSEWPASMVERAIGEVRACKKRKREFPPSCDEILAALRMLKMSLAEQHELCRLRGQTSSIERAKPQRVHEQAEPELTDAERAAMRKRIREHLAGMGCGTEGWA